MGCVSSNAGGMAIAASSGSGVVLAYRWASGWSGMVSPTIAPTVGPQMPAAQTTTSAGISPWSVTTPRTRPSSVRMPVTRCSPRKRAPPSVARRAWASLDADGLGQPVGRDEVAAQHHVAIEQRPRGDRLVRVEQAAFDAPRGRPVVAPVKVDQALRGQRDLEATDLAEAPLSIELERRELLDGVPRELGHRLRPVGLEDEARGVRRRAAGREQAALVHDRDVRPAAQDQLVGQRTAHDPGSDDDDARTRHSTLHPSETWPVSC